MHDRRNNTAAVTPRDGLRPYSLGRASFADVREARLVRKRVNAALLTTCNSPVRILTGPTGWGKTCALQAYVDSRHGESCYVNAGSVATFEELRTRIDSIDEVSEVIVDDADALEPDEGGALAAFVARESHHRRFLLAGRALDRMPARSLLKLDAAETIESADLAFDHDEATALASAFGVRHRHEDLEEVLFETDGWPLALEWIVRYSAYDHVPLYLGYALWRQQCLPHLLAYVERRCRNDAVDFAAFARCASISENSDTHVRLRRFQNLGFPVLSGRESLRPLRFYAAPSVNAPLLPKPNPIAPLRVKLFGRFACDIEGRSVPFKRRRDRHVFSYLALTPKGCAARSELIDAFWSDADPTVASQSLRTTLSRIRQALSEIVGADGVARYFLSDGEICVDFANVSVDARRFVDHIARADAEAARGARAASQHHYAAAERLYDDRLLASEPIETCFEPAIAALARSYERAVQLIGAPSTEPNDRVGETKRQAWRLASQRGFFEEAPIADGRLAMG